MTSSCISFICAVAIDNISNEQFKIANHQKNWFKYTGFVQNLDNIRNQDWTHFDEVYDTHYQIVCRNLDKHMSLTYQEQMSFYVDGVFRDKIDQSISATCDKMCPLWFVCTFKYV